MHSPLATRRRSEAGFTLIELTIGAALMALILASAYACLNSGLVTRRLLEPRWDALQTARVTLALMTADLRAACPLSNEADFIGMDRTAGDVEADNVDFGTLNHSPAGPAEGDFCQTSYYVDQELKTGDWILWRRRNPGIGLDPYTGGSREEIARGVRQLKLEYYDGFDWFDTWGDPDGTGKQDTSLTFQSNLSGMPEAVRITLALASGEARESGVAGEGADGLGAGGTEGGVGGGREAEPPLVFQTVVRLNVPRAASGLGGGSTATDSGSSGSTPNSTTSGGAPGAGATSGRGR
ncbi:MAG: prepilin-type N-terminal cleavage/methylation domain-containing protein [Limisphaerales bacterium]